MEKGKGIFTCCLVLFFLNSIIDMNRIYSLHPSQLKIWTMSKVIPSLKFPSDPFLTIRNIVNRSGLMRTSRTCNDSLCSIIGNHTEHGRDAKILLDYDLQPEIKENRRG